MRGIPIAMIVMVAAGSPALLLAQAALPKPFTVGDVFIDRNGDTLQVVRCRGGGWQAECQVRVVAASGTASIDPSGRWWTVDTLRGSERYWLDNGGAPYAGPAIRVPVTAPAPAPASAARPAAATRAGAGPAAAAGEACPKSTYGGPVPGNRPASAALFRQKITDSITMGAYGNYWYGVKLDGFAVGTPVRNTVSVVPGVGATRVTNGAPPGATLYPVSTTMSVCDGAPGGSSSWRTSQKKYFCFVSKENEWTCGATS